MKKWRETVEFAYYSEPLRRFTGKGIHMQRPDLFNACGGGYTVQETGQGSGVGSVIIEKEMRGQWKNH